MATINVLAQDLCPLGYHQLIHSLLLSSATYSVATRQRAQVGHNHTCGVLMRSYVRRAFDKRIAGACRDGAASREGKKGAGHRA